MIDCSYSTPNLRGMYKRIPGGLEYFINQVKYFKDDQFVKKFGERLRALRKAKQAMLFLHNYFTQRSLLSAIFIVFLSAVCLPTGLCAFTGSICLPMALHDRHCGESIENILPHTFFSKVMPNGKQQRPWKGNGDKPRANAEQFDKYTVNYQSRSCKKHCHLKILLMPLQLETVNPRNFFSAVSSYMDCDDFNPLS